MTRLARARRKLRELHAAYTAPRPSRVRRRIGRLVAHIRYLRRLHFDGHPRDITHSLYPVIVLAHKCGLIVTATTDGTHTPGSYHYPYNSSDGLGHAVDFGNAVPGTGAARKRMIRFQSAVSKKYGAKSLEIFGPGPYYYKNGVRYSGSFPDHQDHVHVAL